MMTEDSLVLKLLSLGMDSSHYVDSNHFVDCGFLLQDNETNSNY
jgi:hypothetical protein